MMLTLIGIELTKIFRKWRSYIGYMAIAVLIPIIQIAMYIEGEHYLDFLTQNLQQVFVFTGSFLNGYLIAHIVFGSLMVHIPFLITLVTGDLLAGEATAGTYRMLLIRPISRFRILTAKFIAGTLYAHSVVLWLGIMSLGLGVLIFGTGELLIVRNELTIFARNDVIWRFVLAYGFAALSMTTVAALSFLFSSLVENSIGPIIGTMAVIISLLIISSLDIGFFKTVRPYLFTNYMNGWRLFFESPVDFGEAVKSGFVLLGHIIAFYALALIIFLRKDINS